MKILDLFSGFGGASEAFAQDEAWGILRIENNPLLATVPHTRSMDIFEFRDWLLEQKNRYGPFSVDVLWASPPCREFSLAHSAPRAQAIRDGLGDEYQPYMGFLDVAMEIIEIVQPRYWIIENVKGAIKYFTPKLGEPSQIHGAYVLWGNYPKFDPGQFPSKADKDQRWSPLRSNYKAKVPIEISQALKNAVESQRTIFDFTSCDEVSGQV